MSTSQGFPQITAPLVDSAGRTVPAWYYFFISLWNRTGQALARDADFRFFNVGTPGNGEVNIQVLTESVQFEVDFTGAYAIATGAPTADVSVIVNKIVSGVATQIGTVSFLTGVLNGTFSTVSRVSFNVNAGEALELVFPNPADATLANVAISFSGAHLT